MILHEQNHRLISSFVICCFILSLYSCQSKQDQIGEIVARVGDSYLTKSELIAWEASLQGEPVTNEMRAAFVRRWVEAAALNFYARQHGFADDPWVLQRIEETTARLIVARFIDKESGNLHKPSIAEAREYYQNHNTEFVHPSTQLTIIYWKSSNREAIESKRNEIIRNRPTPPTPSQFDTLSSNRMKIDGSSGIHPDVWRALSNLQSGAITQVLNIDGQYYLFRIEHRDEAGSTKSFEDVQDQIINLLHENKRTAYIEGLTNQVIEELRQANKLEWRTSKEYPEGYKE